MRKIKTKEELVAKKIVELVNDLTIDLDLVGLYVAQQSSSVLFNRIQVVAESAQYEKEAQYDRQHINPLF